MYRASGWPRHPWSPSSRAGAEPVKIRPGALSRGGDSARNWGSAWDKGLYPRLRARAGWGAQPVSRSSACVGSQLSVEAQPGAGGLQPGWGPGPGSECLGCAVSGRARQGACSAHCLGRRLLSFPGNGLPGRAGSACWTDPSHSRTQTHPVSPAPRNQTSPTPPLHGAVWPLANDVLLWVSASRLRIGTTMVAGWG